MDRTPRIEVIIPVYCHEAELIKSVEMLCRQTLPVQCIHLLHTEDGRSLEKVLAAADPASGVSVAEHKLRKEDFDHGATRKWGASLCPEADYFLFMTQDAVPVDEHLTEELYRGLTAEPMTAVCCGRQIAAEHYSRAEQYSRTFNYPPVSRRKTIADLPELGIKTYFCSDVCAFYDAAVFRKLGGFVDRAVFNEDMIYAALAMKNGYGVYYAAEAKVYHAHDYGPMQQLHRNFDLGASQAMAPEVFLGVKSEGEGVKFAKAVIAHLIKVGAPMEIPKFVVCCAARLLGFKLGKQYKKLPKRWVMRLTGSKSFFAKELG